MSFLSTHGRALRSAAIVLTSTLVVAAASPCAAQTHAQKTKPAPKNSPSRATSSPNAGSAHDQNWQAELSKHPELWQEFGRLLERLQTEVKLPPARSESRLLPLAAKSTVFYGAMPNYGDAAMQALGIFRQELKQSAALRQWWSAGDMAKTGPQLEDGIERFYAISQYLGDEIAISAAIQGDNPNGLLIAEIKKPGLKAALQQVVAEFAAKAKDKTNIRILDPRDLATLTETKDSKDLLLLVRPDYLVISSDAATLRAFNTHLDGGSRDFASTPFGQRVAQAYHDHVTMVGALDLQAILAKARTVDLGKAPGQAQAMAAVEQTGFADVQYLVWEHANSGTQDLSQTELSFTGPRRGMAAWLDAPTPLGSLDFASPKAMMAMSLVLERPAQIFDDVRKMVTATNPNGFAGVSQMEQGLKINIREDLLQPLGGELTIELDGVTPAPVWKAILKVNDPVRLQQTINTLLATASSKPTQFVAAGVTYHKIEIPSGKTPTEIAYAFVDGYMVIGSSVATATEAVRLHRSGESLGRSQRFLASLPAGHPSGVSALVYQDPMAMAAMQMQQLSPDMAGALAKLFGAGEPAVMAAYGEEKVIRGASTSPTMDAAVVLVAAAVAIPNLLRSRTAANEASAVGSLRTVNTAQVTYAATYSDRGFAPDLASLGGSPGEPSAEHAGMIDNSLACSATWCERSGYRFRVSAVCLQGQCPEYVAIATPVNSTTGSRNFCSTSDGVIRFNAAPPLTTPIRPAECRRWAPLR